MRKCALVLLLVIMPFLAGGCGGKSTAKTFLREDVDLGFVTRIAVLPFENQSSDKYVGERVRNVIITQVLALGLFDVVDKGLVDSMLREEALDPGAPIDTNSLKRLGQRLNVQAVMLGSVDLSGETRKGSVVFPELAMTLRLVDAGSGIILWQSSGHRSGDSMMGRLFGVAPGDQFDVALKLSRRMLRSVPRK